MLNNQLFVNKNRFSAVQFTGTVQNSAEIVEWLRDRNMNAKVSSLSTTEIIKGKVVRSTTKILDIACVTTLGQDGWIVEESDNGVTFWDNESFLQNYAPVTASSPV